jgi:hypothetical protein
LIKLNHQPSEQSVDVFRWVVLPVSVFPWGSYSSDLLSFSFLR